MLVCECYVQVFKIYLPLAVDRANTSIDKEVSKSTKCVTDKGGGVKCASSTMGRQQQGVSTTRGGERREFCIKKGQMGKE